MIAKRTGRPDLIEAQCDDAALKANPRVAGVSSTGEGVPGTPKGSFVETCKNTQQEGWRVTSACRTASGEWSMTSTYFKSCPNYSLTNVNGNLVCGL